MILIALVRWLVGLLFLVLAAFNTESWLKATIFLLFACIFIPPVSKFIKDRFKINFDDYLMALLVIIWGIAFLIRSSLHDWFRNIFIGTFYILHFIIKFFTSLKPKSKLNVQ